MRANNQWFARHALLTLVGSSVLASCATAPARNHFARLENWLVCDECVDGEREYVKDLGRRAVGELASALVGPSPQRLALMRAKLGDSYRFAHEPGGNSDAYINPRLANFVATYQKRAAVSLGDIGTDPARQALDQAIRDSTVRRYRSDVIRTIVFVRTNFRAPRFAGRIIPELLSFGDIITVIAPSGQHFTSQDRAALSDSPFSPAEIPFVRLSDTLRFVAVGNAGQHVVFVTDPARRAGPATVASVTITSLLDVTDRSLINCAPADVVCAVASAPRLLDTIAPEPTPTLGVNPVCRAGSGACVIRIPRVTAARLSGSAPITTFLALSRIPPRPDTVDLLKIEPPDTLRVTATLDWRGPANLDLAWRQCSPFIPIPNTTVAKSANVDSSSVVIPARNCWILQVSMGQGGNGPVFARLRLKTP